MAISHLESIRTSYNTLTAINARNNDPQNLEYYTVDLPLAIREVMDRVTALARETIPSQDQDEFQTYITLCHEEHDTIEQNLSKNVIPTVITSVLYEMDVFVKSSEYTLTPEARIAQAKTQEITLSSLKRIYNQFHVKRPCDMRRMTALETSLHAISGTIPQSSSSSSSSSNFSSSSSSSSSYSSSSSSSGTIMKMLDSQKDSIEKFEKENPGVPFIIKCSTEESDTVIRDQADPTRPGISRGWRQNSNGEYENVPFIPVKSQYQDPDVSSAFFMPEECMRTIQTPTATQTRRPRRNPSQPPQQIQQALSALASFASTPGGMNMFREMAQSGRKFSGKELFEGPLTTSSTTSCSNPFLLTEPTPDSSMQKDVDKEPVDGTSSSSSILQPEPNSPTQEDEEMDDEEAELLKQAIELSNTNGTTKR